MKPIRVFVGFVKGKPHVERVIDTYTSSGSSGPRQITVFMTRGEALRRYEVVRPMLLVEVGAKAASVEERE